MMSRYEPFRTPMTLRDAIDRLFQDSFVAPSLLTRAEGTGVPVDLHETADSYVITASLPGWKPDDVNVMVQDNTVTISGEYKEPEQEPEKNKTYHVRERNYSSFQRSFSFPTSIDANQANASFEHGVLTLTLPKAESAKPRRINVMSGQGQSSGQIGQGQSQSGQSMPKQAKSAEKQPAESKS